MVFPFFLLIINIISIILTQDKTTQDSFSPNIVVIPFKTFFTNSNKKTNNNGLTALEYYNQIHSSRLYIQLESFTKIKDNKQQYLNIFTITDESSFYLDDYYSKIGDIICPYSSQLSPSYHYCYNYSYEDDNYSIDNSICAKDNFKVYKDFSLKEYYLLNIEFQHYKDKIADISYACGKTGLKLPSYNIRTKRNLITEIHDKMTNVDYSFTFRYDNKDNANNINDLKEGLFIVGIQSYEKKNKAELLSIYVSQINFGKAVGWEFDIFNIFIGNNYFDFDDLNIEINPNIDGIEITYDFYEKLNEYYFQKYYDKGICMNEKIKHDWNIIIYCYADKFKKIDIDNFPVIKFFKYKINRNFTFSGIELFHQIGDKIFFKMIVNTDNYKTDIIFGRLFMKKFQLIFNSDHKSISFYKNNFKEKNNNNSTKDRKRNILIPIDFFFGILILICGIIIGKNFSNIKRRSFLNELNDNNYIYESKEIKEETNKESALLDI